MTWEISDSHPGEMLFVQLYLMPLFLFALFAGNLWI